MGDFLHRLGSALLEELAQELSAYKNIPIDQVPQSPEKEVHGLGSHIAEEVAQTPTRDPGARSNAFTKKPTPTCMNCWSTAKIRSGT